MKPTILAVAGIAVLAFVAALAWRNLAPGDTPHEASRDAHPRAATVERPSVPAPAADAPASAPWTAAPSADAALPHAGAPSTGARAGPPGSLAAPQSDVQSAALAQPPLRPAVDSGRAQPVFVGLRGAPSVRAGQRVRISVTAESENDFAQIAFALQFDPRVLRVVDVRRGGLMARPAAPAALSYGIDSVAGRVAVQLVEKAGGDPLTGGGDLCSVEFVALAPGRSPLRIVDVAIADLDGQRVAASVLPPATLDVLDQAGTRATPHAAQGAVSSP